MEKYYPSERKYDRAKDAVLNYDRLIGNHADKAELKLVGEGRTQKLDEEELIDFVYNGLGGTPIVTGTSAKQAKEKASEAKQRAGKSRDKAISRQKITVK